MEMKMVKTKQNKTFPNVLKGFFQDLAVEKYKNALRNERQHFFKICNTAVMFNNQISYRNPFLCGGQSVNF